MSYYDDFVEPNAFFTGGPRRKVVPRRHVSCVECRQSFCDAFAIKQHNKAKHGEK